MKAPVGAVRVISYDAPFAVEPGHLLRTTTGRLYGILRVRRSKTKRLRKHLLVVVVAAADPGATVHPLFWYGRRRRR